MRREITTLRLAASPKAETDAFLLVPAGSLSRIRTYGRSINSRAESLIYQRILLHILVLFTHGILPSRAFCHNAELRFDSHELGHRCCGT
jgi:hypothetical protein